MAFVFGVPFEVSIMNTDILPVSANDDQLSMIISHGDSYPITFFIKNSSTNVPINLTGCTAKLTVDSLRYPPDDTTNVFSVDAVLDSDPETGIMSFTPTTLNTSIDPKKYYYDVEITDADSNIKTIAKSTLTIVMDITKPVGV